MTQTTLPIAPSFDSRAFRNTLGRFATGVAVVTAQARDGRPVGMTMTSFNAVSLEPPLVLFSISRRAHSLPAMIEAKGYGINILGGSQEALSNRFAQALTDKWQGVVHSLGFSDAPLLDGAIAHFECRPRAHHDGGDHVIFVVEVVSFAMSAAEHDPLIFFGGQYCRLAQADRLADGTEWPLPIHYF